MENGNLIENFICPHCKDILLVRKEGQDDFYGCRSCGASFPVFFGIPDFRLSDSYEDYEYDMLSCRELIKSYKQYDFKTLWKGYPWKNNLPSRGKVNIKFEKIYWKMEEETFLKHGYAILYKINRYLELKNKPALTRGVSFEAGGAYGLYTLGFSQYFKRVFFTDLSLRNVIIAKKFIEEKKLENVTIFCSDIERLPVRDNMFDFIHCNGVIEHVRNPQNIINEAYRTLKKDGIYMILSPNKYSLWIEPHYRLIGYGFWPKSIRMVLVRKFRKVADLKGTILISLRQLKMLIRRSAFKNSFCVYFLPKNLKETSRLGLVRKITVFLFNSFIIGDIFDFFVNKVFISVMPYHIALCSKKRSEEKNNEVNL